MLDRTLDAVVALPGIDAALVAIGNEGDAPPTTRSAGLSEDEIERTLLQMPNHPDLRALEVVYRYRLDDVSGSAKLPRTALTVALRADGETIGSLAAISRSAADGLPRDDDGRAREPRPPRGPGDLERDCASSRPASRPSSTR